MKIPHKIRISGRISYEVLWVTKFDDPHQGGECWKEGRQIKLLKGMSNQRTLEVLTHEIFHAIEFESETPIPHRCVETLEWAVLRVLKLNGWFKEPKRKVEKRK